VLLGAAEAAILPFFPLLLVHRGLSSAGVGGLLALLALVAMLVNPVWGHVADRWTSAERATVVCAAAGSAAAVSLFAVHGALALAVVACTLWCFRSSLATLADSIALGRLDAGNSGYGVVRSWMSVGWTVAVLAWAAVLQAGSVALLPLLYAAALPAVAAWAGLGMGPRRVVRDRPRPDRQAMRAALRPMAPFLASLGLVMAASFATASFLSLRIEGLGGGLIIIGIAAAVQAAAEVPVMVGMRRLCEIFGRHGLYAAGCGCHAVAFAAWAVLSDPLWIAAVKLIAGVGYALVYVGSVIIVDDLVPATLRASGQGVAKAVTFGVAPIAGSAAGGLLYDLAGPRAMFLAAAAAVTLGAVVAMLAARHAPVTAAGASRGRTG
jgi:MFS family permease